MRNMMKLTGLILLLSLVVSGCTLLGGGVKLEEDQMEFTFDDDGGLTMRAIMEDDEFEDAFDVDFDDKKKDIEEDMVDYMDDERDTDIEIISLKINKDTAEFEIYMEDAEDMYMELDQTLEDLAEDWFDVDIEDLEKELEFVYYKDEEDLDEDDYEDYADDFVINVGGGDEGMYYTFPSKILLVSDKVDFEKESNNTIFVDKDENGYVVIEEY